MTERLLHESRVDAAGRDEPLVSIIVNNFNYGRFLRDAIDSALNQDYPRSEVIVVDDGSTDDSREIIADYGSRIKPVLKPNGGQASALNAGFAASRGDIILFLDADDILFPHAVANVVPLLSRPGTSKVHWPMWLVDSAGARTGGTRPAQVPLEGDFRQQVLARGPTNVASSPTSGNAWCRHFLDRILPIPEDLAYYKSCADEYLYTLAPVFGHVATIDEPQGCYRIHGENVYSSLSFREQLEMELSGYDEQCIALSNALGRNGIAVDTNEWKQHSWFHRLDRAVKDVMSAVPLGSKLVLVDGNTWGVGREFEGRTVRPFLDKFGVDWGPPAADQMAINQLQFLRERDVQFLVIAWPCFWWLDEFTIFSKCLNEIATCVIRNEAVIIYDFQLLTAESVARRGSSRTKGGREHV